MNYKFLGMTALTATLIGTDGSAQKISYPKTNQIEHIDEYHGTKISDP